MATLTQFFQLINMMNTILQPLLKEEIITDNKTALIVVDMLNDGFRKKGAFATIGFDISSFNDIEKNVSGLANSFSKKGREVIYVRTFYDFEYLPKTMVDKFISFGFDKMKFCQKGDWGSQLIDSLPDVATAFVIKSHYSPFSVGFSALFDRQSFSKNQDYFLSISSLDDEFKRTGRFTLKDYYKQSLEHEIKAIRNTEIQFPISLHGYLKSKAINSLICVGASTHVCLGATVYSASERGYKVILPIDAIASEDEKKHEIYLHNFSMFNSNLTLTKYL
jgi:nicotinamidase-related amidase